MVFALCLFALTPAPPDLELRAAIHVHTTFSDGKHSIAQLADLAREAGIDVIVLGDHFMDEITYGLPLAREAVSKTIRIPSLSPEALPAFLQAAREVERNSGVLVLPGVEFTPHYYWQGSPFRGDWTVRSGDRHLLAIFPERPEPQVLARALPTVASPAGRRLGAGSLLLLWPLVSLAWALHRLFVPPVRTARTRHFLIRRRERGWAAWIVAVFSLAMLGRSWPFTVPRFSPYAEAGVAPYQYAADRAASADALTFWPHPESAVEYRHPRYPVTYRSEPYPDLVYRVRGITGFASLFEGYRTAAAPGGPWDEALAEFCRGKRSAPVWTMGEISLHEQAEAGGKRLGDVETVLRVHERSRAAVLEALASGFGYAVRHAAGGRLVLEEFSVTSGGHKVLSGDHLESAGERTVEVRLRREGEKAAPVKVRVIRDGTVVRSEALEVEVSATSLTWVDEVPLRGESFYRIAVEGSYPEMILSNPVFVSPRESRP